MKPLLKIKETETGVILKIKVQPKASKNEIKGLQGDALKVRLTAPPVDGAANTACQSFFSDLFKIPKNRVKIIAGLTNRNKTLLLEGLSKLEFDSIIDKYVNS